jgi:pimeloyl-ACP methyl ester carboxylesterase
MNRCEKLIPSSINPHHNIFVRLVEPESTPKGLVLFLHGANLGSICFDVPCHEGQTWLEYMASRGLVAAALDYRGYSRSSRFAEMDLPMEQSKYLATHKEAVQDTLDVIQNLQSTFGNLPMTLVGFSWGSVIAGYVAQHHPHLVQRLIVLGGIYSCRNPRWEGCLDPKNPSQLNPNIGGYRILSKEALCNALWDAETPGNDKNIWRDPQIVEMLLEDVLNCDKDWAEKANMPGHIRVPSGILQDVCAIYSGRPIYEASQVFQPTLIIRGDHDIASLPQDMEQLRAKLGSSQKEFLTIENATHYACLEKRAIDIWKSAADFILV